MDVTTIKLRSTTKRKLDSERLADETYDQTIARLLNNDNALAESLKAGYQAQSEHYLAEERIWSKTTSSWPQ